MKKYCEYLLRLNQSDRATRVGKKATELAEQFAQALPQDLAAKDLQASCHNNYADALLRSSSLADANSHFQKAIEIRERIDPVKLPGVTIHLAQSS